MRIRSALSWAAAIVAIAGVFSAGNMARADYSATQLLRSGGLKQLAPCKFAAARHCDRSGGLTTSNLLRCGAVLAAISDQVGNQCRHVLRRFGQI
jgi:hypothetical protein